MPLPVVPLVLLGGGALVLGWGALSQKKSGGSTPGGGGGQLGSGPTPGGLVFPPDGGGASPQQGSMPPEVRVAFNQLLQNGRDPVSMEAVAAQCEKMGYLAEARQLRERAAQLKVNNALNVPVIAPQPASMPVSPPAPVPAPNVVVMAQVNTQTDPLNIRSAPNATASILGKAPKGAMVQVLNPVAAPGWTQIQFNSVKGFASSQYLKMPDSGSPLQNASTLPNILPPSPTPQAVLTATVTTSRDPLNMRSSPNASASLVTSVPKGASVTVLNPIAAPGWMQISYGGKTGYSSSQYLTMNAPTPPAISGYDVVVGGVDHGKPPMPLRCAAPGGCRLRVAPNGEAKPRAIIASGEVVHGLRLAPGPKSDNNSPSPGGWVQVRYRNLTGWVPAEWFVAVNRK
jgi:uncharacterized protein YgiM (DUF1202 family)